MLSQEQIDALKEFAEANGRSWKSKLNHCWMTGLYRMYNGTGKSHVLQGIRNQFGPTWLSRFSLKGF